MRKIRIVFAAIFIIPILILSLLYAFLPASIMALFGLHRARRRYLGACGHFIANCILFFLGIKVHVDGLQKIPVQTNICYMANHQSMLDIVAFYGPAHLWASILAKAEVKKIPIINLWCYAFDCIFIERSSPHDAVKAILKGVERLKNGQSMLVFPEGTRSKNGKIGVLKSGSLKLATRSKAVIVPITIKGLRAGYENLSGWKKVHAYLSISDPIYTKDLSDEELSELHTTVFGTISKRFDELPGQV